MKEKQRTVIITGMHRSGTSLVSSLLQKAGLYMGNRLVGPYPGNLRGHFEDADFQQWHERILRRFGQSHLVQDSATLEQITATKTGEALSLIKARSEYEVWGWKDPRTALFLEFWHSLLPAARYIFIYRHPVEVTLSVLRRGIKLDLAILRNPLVGLRVWQVYNKAILAFYRQHPESCLLCHIAGITADIEAFIELTAKKLNLPLRKEGTSLLYHTDELRQMGLAGEVNTLLGCIAPEVLKLYEQLEGQANLPSRPIDQMTTLQNSQLAELQNGALNLGQHHKSQENLPADLFSQLLTMLDSQAVMAGNIALDKIQTTPGSNVAEMDANKTTYLKNTQEDIHIQPPEEEKPTPASKPLLSVCIPTYNGARYVAETISSVLDQSFADFELILVDDCSSDSTKEILKSFDDERIKYFENHERLGLVENWNRCIELASGEYICIFHHDDLMLQQNLEQKMGILSNNPKVGFVYSDVMIIDGRGNILYENWYFKTDCAEDCIVSGLDFFEHLLIGSNIVCCPGVVARKECYEKVGSFDVRLPFTADWEMWLRIAQSFDIAYLTQRLIKYREHQNSETGNFNHTVRELEQYHLAKMIALDRSSASNSKINEQRLKANNSQVQLALQRMFKFYQWRQYDVARQFLAYAAENYELLAETEQDKNSVEWFLGVFDDINALIETFITNLEQQRDKWQTLAEQRQLGLKNLEQQRANWHYLAGDLQLKKIEQQGEQIWRQKSKIEQQGERIKQQQAQIEQQQSEVAEHREQIWRQKSKIEQQGERIKQQQAQIEQQQSEVAEHRDLIEQQLSKIEQQGERIKQQQNNVEQQEQQIARQQGKLEQQQNQINHEQNQLNQQYSQIHNLRSTLKAIYQTKAWRTATGYWKFKEFVIATARKSYRLVVPDKIRLSFRNWRHPEELKPARPKKANQVKSNDVLQKIPPRETNISSVMEKHIAFVLPCGLTLGGVTTWSIEMSRRLANLNTPTTIIKHPNFGTILDIDMPPQVPLIDSSCHPSPMAEQLMQAVPDYYKVLPAVIVPNYDIGPYALCALLSVHESKDMRVIGYCHTDDFYYYALLAYYEPIIHLFVAVSRESAATLAKIIPHRQADIIVRPYGVSVPKTLERCYSAKDKPLQLIYAGRIAERQKRVSDLPKLAQALAKENIDFHLRVVGSGPEREMLSNSIQALDESIRQRITMIKSVSPAQMPDIWRSSDICILVSEFEGTSISMLEAMAWGCVPVVTRVSGAKAVINYGHNGFLAPIGDVAAMARIIKLIDYDRDCLTKLGNKAHTMISEQYAYNDYINFFRKRADEVWQQPSRSWPMDKEPLLSRKQRIAVEKKIRTQISPLEA